MRTLSLVGGTIVAAVVWLPASAGAEGGFPKTRVGFQGPADRLWEGSVALPACTRERSRLMAMIAPRGRLARQERRGEVIAEFVGPPPIAAATVAQARQCAASAGDEATAPVLLTGGAQGFTRFQSAFSVCMAKADQPQAVGSMTLWVDNRCNW
jgi:hypothetical protein